MTENKKASWLELCELASKEQDPKKLRELIAEIERLLAEDDKPVRSVKPKDETGGGSL